MAKDRIGGGFSQKDAQKATNATRKQTSKAHHQARNDAAKTGGWNVPKNRNKK